MIVVLIIVLIALIISLVGGYLLFTSVLDQKKYKKPEEPIEIKDDPKHNMYPTFSRLYAYQRPLIQKMKDLSFEELDITSFDNLKLHGHLLRGNPKEVVILVHGYRSNYEDDFCDRIQIYQKRNSTILLVDDRAHGKSEGRYIGFSELDKYDVAKWVDKINELFDNPSIYLHGVSMGGATVLHCADMHLKNVKGIVDDCGFDSIDHLTRSIIKENFHIPYFPIGDLSGVFSKLIAHMDFKASDGRKSVQNSNVPIVFIHGLEDHFVPVSMGQKMYELCTSPKELLLVPGAGHAACFMMDEEKYTDLVNRLLDGKIK